MTSNMATKWVSLPYWLERRGPRNPPTGVGAFAISDNDNIIKKKKKMGFFSHFKEIHFIMVFIIFFFVMGHGIFGFYINNGNSTHVLR